METNHNNNQIKHGYEEIRMDPSTVVGNEGFYRAGKDTEGRWWFLRPGGQPFIYKGVCAVCDGIPPHNGKPGNDYWQNYQKVYGKDDRRFALDSFRVLDDLGFNAFGMWCFIRNPHARHEELGWPFIEYIHAREIYPQGAVDGSFLKTIDAFDPNWERAYDKACAERCTRYRDSTNLLGYFTDNEPFWGQPFQKSTPEETAKLAQMQNDFHGQTSVFDARNRAHRWGVDSLDELYVTGTLLQVFLNLPPERAGHKAAWDFVLKRHGGSVAQVAKDWGVDFSSPEDLRAKSGNKDKPGLVLNSAAYGRDHDDFTRLYAQTYFRVTGEAIRRYDPNHMRLGVRHHSHCRLHGEVALREYANVRQHVEVFSMNTYSDHPHDAVAGYARFVDMPMIVGEFSWGGWIYDGQTYPPAWQHDHEGWLRQEGVRRTAKMFTVPQLAGYTWFKWYCGNKDPDVTSYTVVTDDFILNRFNAPMFRRLHAALEDIHAGLRSPDTL